MDISNKTVAAREPEIRRRAQDIGRAIENLSAAISDLYAKLKPVINNTDENKPPAEQSAKKPSLTEFGEELYTLERRLYTLHERVVDLNVAIEL